MAIDAAIISRITQLIDRSSNLSIGDENGQCVEPRQQQECVGWIAAAQNAVHLICESPSVPYRQAVDRIASGTHGYAINEAVGSFAEVLKNLIADAAAGMLASVANQARAEVFDDFLDHADAYLKESRKNESGVIGGVVFDGSRNGTREDSYYYDAQ